MRPTRQRFLRALASHSYFRLPPSTAGVRGILEGMQGVQSKKQQELKDIAEEEIRSRPQGSQARASRGRPVNRCAGRAERMVHGHRHDLATDEQLPFQAGCRHVLQGAWRLYPARQSQHHVPLGFDSTSNNLCVYVPCCVGRKDAPDRGLVAGAKAGFRMSNPQRGSHSTR